MSLHSLQLILSVTLSTVVPYVAIAHHHLDCFQWNEFFHQTQILIRNSSVRSLLFVFLLLAHSWFLLLSSISWLLLFSGLWWETAALIGLLIYVSAVFVDFFFSSAFCCTAIRLPWNIMLSISLQPSVQHVCILEHVWPRWPKPRY